MAKISFKPFCDSDAIFDVYVNGKIFAIGERQAQVHFDKRIRESSNDLVTIYVPYGETSFQIASFPRLKTDEEVFIFARKYVRLFIDVK